MVSLLLLMGTLCYNKLLHVSSFSKNNVIAACTLEAWLFVSIVRKYKIKKIAELKSYLAQLKWNFLIHYTCTLWGIKILLQSH